MAGRGAPGANSRGRGGKFRKFTRGGGKHFSRDLRPLDADGNEISMWSEDAQKKNSDSEEDSEEDSSEEESDSDDDAAGGSSAAAAASREDRKKEKKARKDAAIARAKGRAVQVGDLPSSDSEDDDDDDDDLPANPNHSKASRKQTAVPRAAPAANDGVDAAANGIKKLKVNAAPASRKERESLEAQQAKERYRKLHEAGKTDEAKADLARLAIIREKRELEAARKQAEKEEKEEREKSRKAEIQAREAKLREAAMGKPKRGKK